MLVPLAKTTKPGSADYSGERLVNCYAHLSDSVSQVVLFGRNGLVSYVDLGTNLRVRAMAEFGGSIYAVFGGIVWKISGGTATNVGTVTDGETYLAASEQYLAIVVGGTYYLCDGTTTTAYSTGAVTNPVGVAYMDGYFIVIGASAGRSDAITVSNLDDATTFDALRFAFAESSPDPLVGIIADHNELWMFGTETVQVFYNAGDPDFPFFPNKGALIEQGCLAGKSLAKADNAVFWVTPDGKAARSFGGTPEWISTPEIRSTLAGSDITGAFTFTERGHEFYAITREGQTALVYDISTGLWHERATGLDYTSWAVHTGCKVAGAEYFGTNDGVIATSSASVFTELGGVLMLEAISPLTENKGQPFRVQRIYADIASGGTDIGRTPQVMLQTTRDGYTWGEEKWRDLGGVSRYSKRAQWFGLGMFYTGALRVRITDPVKRDIVGIWADMR